MPLIDLRQARAEIRLACVLELLGWRARERCGEQVRGPCPVHRSRSPTSRSFSAHLGKGARRCFACEACGNVVELWMKVTGLGLYPAVLELYKQLGRDVPWLGTTQPSINNDKREIRHMRD